MKTSDFEVFVEGEYMAVSMAGQTFYNKVNVHSTAGQFLLAWLEEQGQAEPDLGACEECAHLCRDFDDKPSCGVGLAWKYGVGYCAERQPKKAGPIKLTERTDAEKIEWLIGKVAELDAANKELKHCLDSNRVDWQKFWKLDEEMSLVEGRLDVLEAAVNAPQKPWRPTRRQGV